MDLMTSHRAIPATDAQIHIHHEQVRAIDYSGRDFFGGSYDSSSVCRWFGWFIIRFREVWKLLLYQLDQLPIGSQLGDRNFQYLGTSHDLRHVTQTGLIFAGDTLKP